MEPIRLLAADDDETSLFLLRLFCDGASTFDLRCVTNGENALRAVERGDLDILLTDLRMPLLSGGELLDRAKRLRPDLPVIIMTGYGSIEGAVDYLQRGADDYLTKPLTREVFLHRLDRVVERVSLTREVARLRSARELGPLERLIGTSPAMLALKRQLPTVAQTEASVVIYGESGTGKELVAKALHTLSRRAEGPFVAVNCGALPEALLESELFGHRRGAFTDAHADTLGLVDAAHTGTLFLDEIGEIPPGVQVKLLRFLESKEYKPLGAPRTKVADVRIIAATNRDLRRAVDEKLFREDLYYRLNIVPIYLPSLKNREGDITMLANHFVEETNRRLGKAVRLSADACTALEQHPWPGNVRELENKIEQIVVMSQGSVVGRDELDLQGRGHGPPTTSAPPSDDLLPYAIAKRKALEAFERNYVISLLTAAGGHLTKAAHLAGIDRKNLWQILKRHDLERHRFRELRRSPRA